jgi:hypothetical protein
MTGARKGMDNVKLIVVGKNPGHPVSEEAMLYRQALSTAQSKEQQRELLFDAMVSWGERCHLTYIQGRKGTYHKQLMRFLRDVLDTNDNEEVLDTVYFTEAMKCSTPNDLQARLESKTVRLCMTNWLAKEFAILPKVPILALGREADCFLRKMFPEMNSRVVYLSHPSWPFKNYELAKQNVQSQLKPI